MKSIQILENQIFDLQMQIRSCNPEKLGLIVLQLIDFNVNLVQYLTEKEMK